MDSSSNALDTTTPKQRPSEWTYASPDLNVLLCGHLVEGPVAEGYTVEGLQFQLDEGGLYIEHPSLVSITTTPTSQFLSSINTGQPILTLAIPLLLLEDSSTSPSRSPSPSHTPPAPSPILVTLHAPLLTPSDLPSIQQSPLYSTTFQLLLDGPNFLQPHFDPQQAAAAPSTPQVSASSASILNSPTIQRALLSPLLSPQRRASHGGQGHAGDSSVPHLSLGSSRGRAPSLSSSNSANQIRTTNGLSSSPSPSTARSSAHAAAPPGLTALLPPAPSRPSLESLQTTAISSRAKQTAEEIMALRRSHDAFVRRVKYELEILTARIREATEGNLRSSRDGQGVVKGFKSVGQGGDSKTQTQAQGQAKDKRTESLSREQSRSRSVGERGSSAERGRDRAQIAATGAASRDEEISRFIRASDEKEEEERGRSLSRARGRGTGEGAGGGAIRGQSKTGKAVKEVLEKAAAAGYPTKPKPNALASPRVQAQRSPAIRTVPLPGPAKGEEIPASVDDEDEVETSIRSPLPPPSPAAAALPPSPALAPIPSPSPSKSTQSLPSSPSATPASAPGQSTSTEEAQPTSISSSSETGPSTPNSTRAVTLSPRSFVPSSHVLVQIPEEEELSLPPSGSSARSEEARRAGGDGEQGKRENGRALEKEAVRVGSDAEERDLDASEEEEDDEDDTPFEMDEDIAISPSPPMPSSSSAGSAPPAVGEFDATPSAPQPQHQTSQAQSFRPGSMARASSLSASYNALLSMSSRPRPPPPPGAPRSPLPPPSTDSNSLALGMSSSPPDASHPTSTSAREDIRIAALRPRPDEKEKRKEEERLRKLEASDAPSHRGVAPRKMRFAAPQRGRSRGEDEEEEEEDGEEEDEQEWRSARMKVGSVPISIGFARPTASSSAFRPTGERELQRKTSVPSREGMFVPPLYRPGQGQAGARRKSAGGVKLEPEEGSKAAQEARQQQQSSATTTSSATTAATAIPAQRPSATASTSALSSSLARSLLSPPSAQGQGGIRSFSQVAEAEEEDNDHEGGAGEEVEVEGEEEEEDDFVPPHEFVARGRRDEEMLSRSVSSY